MQDLVAYVMSETIVDLLEMVEVDHQHPERPAEAVQLGEPPIQLKVEVASIGQTGQIVDEREVRKLLDELFLSPAGDGAAENLDGADHAALTVVKRPGLDANGDAVAHLVLQVGVVFERRLAAHGLLDRTAIRAQRVPIRVDVAQPAVAARLA